MTLVEREEISRGLVNGRSLRVIACGMRRAASTVSREIARNGGLGCYRAAASDRQAWRRALRPKACKLATHPQLRGVVTRLLQRNWSPQQIAGWLRLKYPEDEAFWVSHETIYRSLFVQARGVLKGMCRSSRGDGSVAHAAEIVFVCSGRNLRRAGTKYRLTQSWLG